jgi:hypothetical protein
MKKIMTIEDVFCYVYKDTLLIVEPVYVYYQIDMQASRME